LDDPDTDFVFYSDSRILDWGHADPKPTPAQVQAVLDSPAFADWQTEHGGDEQLTRRRRAKDYLDDPEALEIVLRAIVMLTTDEINILRAEHGKAPRTWLQVKDAIKTKITAGDAD
jgi:hypothetical protein